MKYLFLILLLCFSVVLVFAAKPSIVMGPITGHQTDSSAILWVLVSKAPNAVSIESQNIKSFEQLDDYLFQFAMEHNYDAIYYNKKSMHFIDNYSPLKIVLSNSSEEHFDVQEKPHFASPELQNFSFLVGSGFRTPLKDPLAERVPSIIMNSMVKKNADFMVWLGTNLLGEEEEGNRKNKSFDENIAFRTHPEVAKFMMSCRQYAVCDKPGNNSANKAPNEKTIFELFWPNPELKQEISEASYSKFTHQDADFFLLDNCGLKESGKNLFGNQQLIWLTRALKESTASFKFILSGTPILAQNKNREDLSDYPDEKETLLRFIKKEKVSGVVFLNGDINYSELNFLYRSGSYPLHEFVCGPLSENPDAVNPSKNDLRVKKTLVKEENFGRVTISGTKENRICRMEVFDKEGILLWSYSMDVTEIL